MKLIIDIDETLKKRIIEIQKKSNDTVENLLPKIVETGVFEIERSI